MDHIFTLIFILAICVIVLALKVMSMSSQLTRIQQYLDKTDSPDHARVSGGAAQSVTHEPDIGWVGQATDKAIYEKFESTSKPLFGGNWLAKFGMIILLIGIAFFIKLAIDHGIFNLTARFISASVVGLVLILIGLWLKRKSAFYGQLCMAGGLVVFYLCAFIGGFVYLLITPFQVMLICGVISVLMLALSYWQRSLAIAITGQVLAFIVPLFFAFVLSFTDTISFVHLHSTMQNDTIPFYLLGLNVLTIVLGILARFISLYWLGFILTLLASLFYDSNINVLSANMALYFIVPFVGLRIDTKSFKMTSIFLILVSSLAVLSRDVLTSLIAQTSLHAPALGIVDWTAIFVCVAAILMALLALIVHRSRGRFTAEVYLSAAFLSAYFIFPVQVNVAIVFAIFALASLILGVCHNLSFTRCMGYLYGLVALLSSLSSLFVVSLTVLGYFELLAVIVLITVALYSIVWLKGKINKIDCFFGILLSLVNFWFVFAFITLKVNQYDYLFASLNFIVLLLVGLAYCLKRNEISSLGVSHPHALGAIGLLTFLAATLLIANLACQFLGVGYTSNIMLINDTGVQASITIFWALLGLILTPLGTKKSINALWCVGIGLLVLSALKLVFVDMAQMSGMIRVASFIAVGIIFLLVGYVSPRPATLSLDSDL